MLRRSLLLLLLPALVACATDVKTQSACGDLSPDDRSSPWADPIELLDTYDGPSFSELGEVRIVGDVAWFCTSVIGLNAYHAADPRNLVEADSLGFSLGSGVYPRCDHLAVDASTGTVYVTSSATSIQRTSFIGIADGSNPDDIRELASIEVDDEIEGIVIADDLLLVAAHEGGLAVWARGVGADIELVGRAADIPNANDVVVGPDGLAYVTDPAGALFTVDLADPTAPVVLDRLEVPGAPKDVIADLPRGRLFVGAGSGGVVVVSIDDPRAPQVASVADTPGSVVAVAYSAELDHLAVADWTAVRVFDASGDELSSIGHEPLPLGAGTTSRTLGVAFDGDVVYSGNWRELASYRVHPDRRAPDAEVAPGILLLPDTGAGESSRGFFRLHNRGTETLTVRGAQVGAPTLTVEGVDAGTLEPGEDLSGSVEFAPGGSGALTSWLDLLTDDPDQPRQCIPVRANHAGASVGDSVSDISFLTRENETFRLSDLRGGPVLLAYFATF